MYPFPSSQWYPPPSFTMVPFHGVPLFVSGSRNGPMASTLGWRGYAHQPWGGVHIPLRFWGPYPARRPKFASQCRFYKVTLGNRRRVGLSPHSGRPIDAQGRSQYGFPSPHSVMLRPSFTGRLVQLPEKCSRTPATRRTGVNGGRAPIATKDLPADYSVRVQGTQTQIRTSDLRSEIRRFTDFAKGYPMARTTAN